VNRINNVIFFIIIAFVIHVDVSLLQASSFKLSVAKSRLVGASSFFCQLQIANYQLVPGNIKLRYHKAKNETDEVALGFN